DANGKIEVTKGIAQLMQTCVIDENQVDKYYDIILGSSVTPLPLLANGEADYPEIKIPSLANRVAVQPPTEPKLKGESVGPPGPGMAGGFGAQGRRAAFG